MRRFLLAAAIGSASLACAGDGAEPASTATVSGPTTPDGTGTVASTSSPTTEDRTTTREASSSTTSTTNQQSTTETEQGMEVYFAVEGGFANQMRSLRLGSDGAAEVEVSGRSSQRVVDADVVAAIVAELDGSELFDQDRNYEPSGGADLQRYEIRYNGATVVANDTTVPPELTEAISLLEAALRGIS